MTNVFSGLNVLDLIIKFLSTIIGTRYSNSKACPTSEDKFVANTVGNTFSCLDKFKQKDKTMLATVFCENVLRCGSGFRTDFIHIFS